MQKTSFLIPIRLNVYLAFSAFLLVFSSCQKESSDYNQLSSTSISQDKTVVSALVAWYTFNGDTLDHSGNGNDVTFNNATPATGRNGLPNNAYYFNGINSYMTVANSTSLNPISEITLFARVKVQGFYQGLCHGNQILIKGNDVQTYGMYSLAFDDARYYAYGQCLQPVSENHENFFGRYGDGSGSSGADAVNYLKPDRWYSIAYTYNGRLSKFYVNGVQVSALSKTTTFTPNADNLFIGKLNNPSYPYWFNGVIDEIRIYNKALSLQQVQNLSQ